MLISDNIILPLVISVVTVGVSWGVIKVSLSEIKRDVKVHQQLLYGKEGESRSYFITRDECSESKDLQCKKISNLTNAIERLQELIQNSLQIEFNATNERWDKVVNEHGRQLTKIQGGLNAIQNELKKG